MTIEWISVVDTLSLGVDMASQLFQTLPLGALLSTLFLTTTVTWFMYRRNRLTNQEKESEPIKDEATRTEKLTSFDIAPDDEVEFTVFDQSERVESTMRSAETSESSEDLPNNWNKCTAIDPDVSMISLFKEAKTKVIRKQMPEMSEKEKEEEDTATSQTLAKVYEMMNNNKDMFGDMSFEEVKAQFAMYQ